MANVQRATTPKVKSFSLPMSVRDHLNAAAARRGISADALVHQILIWGLADTPTYELGSLLNECRAGYRLTPALRRQWVDAVHRHGGLKKQSALFVAIVQTWFAQHEPDVDLDAAPTDSMFQLTPQVWEQLIMSTRAEPQHDSNTQWPMTRAQLQQSEASVVNIPFDAAPKSIDPSASRALDALGLPFAPDEKIARPEPVGAGPSIQAAAIRRLALHQAIETVAAACYGDDPAIKLAYQLFRTINSQWFADTLPLPFIIRGLTPYSHGFSWLQTQGDAPLLFLHPRLFATAGLDRQKHKKATKVWGVSSAWFGPHLLGDVILHECLHAHLTYNKGGAIGPTSHNNPGWVAEVNRLLPLLGFHQLRAGRSKTVRVPVAGRGRNRRPESDGHGGPSRVERTTDGNIPFKAVSGFPTGVRRWLQNLHETEEIAAAEQQLLAANATLAAEAYYRQDGLPFGLEKEKEA